LLKGLRRLILVGAGSFVHEVLWLAGEVRGEDCDWRVAGFLDDEPDRARDRLQRKMVELPVLGTTFDYVPRQDDCFAMSLASPTAKLTVGERLGNRGASFINLVHPSLTVMQHAVIGTGCVFMARTNVGPYSRIGNFVTLNNNSGVAHDTIIEDGVTLSGFCDVTGGCVLRRGAFLGSHAVVLPGAEIGEFGVVGAGSVVLRRVKARTSVFGVPAKEFR